jgi:hypothetical protein
MLRLFQSGATSYQPEGLAYESGDPQVTLENLRQLMAQGLRIRDFLIRPTGVLVTFSTGEQYYTPALRIRIQELAEIAAEAGFGTLAALRTWWLSLPPDFTGPLESLHPASDFEPPPLSHL